MKRGALNGLLAAILLAILMYVEAMTYRETVTETVPLPPCAECQRPEVVYSPNESEAPDFPFISGWTCSKPCID